MTKITPAVTTFVIGAYTITNQKLNLSNNFLIKKKAHIPIGMDVPLSAIQFRDTDKNTHYWYYPTEAERDTDFTRIDTLDISNQNGSLTSVFTDQVASSTAGVLVAANPNRKKVVITNHSPYTLYLLEGITPTVSINDYIYLVQPGGLWISTDTADNIQGVWAIPDGTTPTPIQKANILESF